MPVQQASMRTPHLSAEVHFLPAVEGGRSSPVYSGYRGQFHHKCGYDIADVEWYIIDVECLAPGETGSCHIWFVNPDVHLPLIELGDTFEIREGKRVVASGRILSFVREV